MSTNKPNCLLTSLDDPDFCHSDPVALPHAHYLHILFIFSAFGIMCAAKDGEH